MKKALLFFIGVIAWLFLVNLFVATGDEFGDILSTQEGSETTEDSSRKLSIRNTILNIGMKNQLVLIAAILIWAIWESYWTVKACWSAAKNNDFNWFVFMLLFSLLGIPEIYYLHFRKSKVNGVDPQ